MTRPDIQLSTAEVRQHARMVDQAAGMCRDAAAAAEHIDLHDEAYGILCSPLAVPYMNTCQHSALREIRNAAELTGLLADQLRMLAAHVDAADSRAEQRNRAAGR